MTDDDNLHAGFCQRLLYYLCDRALAHGTPGPTLNGAVLTVSEMERMVANARRRGWLK